MSTLARLDTVFGSDIKGLVAGAAAVQKKVLETQAVANKGAAGVSSALSAIGTAGAAVGVALAAATVAGISKFQEVAGETRTLEKQLGTTAEQASVLRAQAEALGVSTDKLSVGFGIFAKHVVANDAVLQQYGITAKTTADGQIDFQATLAELSDTFSAMPPGLERTAAAMNLFGRSGKSLLPLLAASSEELAQLAANAIDAGLVMSEDDVQAARELSIAQRELGAAFDGVQVSLARAVIPMLTEMLGVIAKVVRTISPFLPLIRDVGLAFAAYKAFTFVPTLLLAIGSAFEFIGATQISGVLLSAAVALDSLTIAALPIAAVFVALGGAILSVTGVIQNFEDVLTGFVTDSLEPFAKAQELSEKTGISLSKAFDLVTAAAEETADEVDPLADIMDKLTVHVNGAGEVVRNFAGLSRGAMREFKASVVESVQVSIGQFKNVKDAFQLTTRQLQNQADAAVRIARQQQRDLRAIFSDKSISEGAKLALASLPADQRHAWAEGGKAARQQIAKDAVTLKTVTDRTYREVTKSAAALANTGGHTIGAGLGDGVLKGIALKSPAISEAARQAIQDAIDAAKAQAGISSPSKVMAKVGQQLMDGLALGIDSRIGKLQDQLRALVKLIRDTVGTGAADQASAFLRDLDEMGRRFDRLASKIEDFRGAIQSGFEQIDLVGSISDQIEQFQQDMDAFNDAVASGDTTATAPAPLDLHQAIADQIAQAKQMAAVLRQLSAAGLNASSLADIASKGPAGIAEGQALLQDPTLIQELNDATAQLADIMKRSDAALTGAQFGEDVEKLGDQFDRLLHHLEGFLKAIPVPELTDKSRDFIQALTHMIDFLEGLTGGGHGGHGGPAGGAPDLGASPRGFSSLEGGAPAVLVNIYGDVTGEDVADKVEEGLQRKLNRSGAILNGAVRRN